MDRKDFMEDVMSPSEDGTVPSMEEYILNNAIGQQCEKYENYSKQDLVKEFEDRGGSFITADDIDVEGSFSIGTRFTVHSPSDSELRFFRDQEEVELQGFNNVGLAILMSCSRGLRGFIMERESLSIIGDTDV